jgi:probable HAF family extracellular repeat protein
MFRQQVFADNASRALHKTLLASVQQERPSFRVRSLHCWGEFMKQFTQFAVPLLFAIGCAGADQHNPTAPELGKSAASQASSPISITDLGTLGGTTSEVYSLNTPTVGNRLLIVGRSFDKAGTQHASYWYVNTATGARQAGALPVPAGDVQSWAAGVNQSERIVGGSINTPGGLSAPVQWAPGGWSPSLLDMNGGNYGTAQSINSVAQIIGYAGLPNIYGALWEGNAMTQLPSFGGRVTQAFDINSAGVVVGGSQYAGSDQSRAFVWTKSGSMIQLPDAGFSGSRAWAINDYGVIVGNAWVVGSDGPRAVRWLPPTVAGGAYTMEDLGLTNATAYDINNSGEIVGQYSSGSTIRAFYWLGGHLKDLPLLQPVRGGGARSINENGDVAGWSRLPSSYQHAVLWMHVR